MKSWILAFDIGTSACKAAVFSEKREILYLKKRSYSLKILENGWIEQDPYEILKELTGALADIEEAGCDLSRIGAISFSAQISSQFLTDDAGRPLTRMISWMDKRAEKEAEEYKSCFTREKMTELTGVDMEITASYIVPRLRWMSKNIPHLLEKARYIVQIKDWIIFYLTGRWVSDATSLKGIVDLQGNPVSELLEFAGAGKHLILPVKKPDEIAGTLKKHVRGFERLRAGIPVVVGWNDMNTAFLSASVLGDDKTAVDLTGTSEHLGVILDGYDGNKTVQGVNLVPFLENKSICYGVTSSGGQVFDWYVHQILGAGRDYSGILAKAEAVPLKEAENLICLPYITGERNPWYNPDACCTFSGLQKHHTEAHMTLALLEGIAFTLRAIMEKFPQKPKRCIVTGGASENGLLNQIKADILGIPFERTDIKEAGCDGAAILAQTALNGGKSIYGPAYKPKEQFMPRDMYAAFYHEKYRRFLKLYKMLYPG